MGYSDFAGVSVVETESLQDGQEFPVIGHGEFAGQTGEGGVFREMVWYIMLCAVWMRRP